MSTFWNHNKEYFYMLKVEHNQRTFIYPPPSRLKSFASSKQAKLTYQHESEYCVQRSKKCDALCSIYRLDLTREHSPVLLQQYFLSGNSQTLYHASHLCLKMVCLQNNLLSLTYLGDQVLRPTYQTISCSQRARVISRSLFLCHHKKCK